MKPVTLERSLTLSLLTRLVLLAGVWLATQVQADQFLYTDTLQNGWQNWSWATVDFSVASPVHSGSASIGVTSTNWQALYLHHSTLDTSPYASLDFWIDGGGIGGQSVQVQGTRGGIGQAAFVLSLLPVNSWRHETISLQSLGVANATDFDGLWFQVRDIAGAPTFYVDDIRLIEIPEPSAAVLVWLGCVATVIPRLNRARPSNSPIRGQAAFA